jgi:UDP-glucose 4-epimerase
MHIVITGALGHIGSRLIRELPELVPSAQVSMIDNFLTQRYCSLFDLPKKGKYRFIEADIMTADLPSLFTGADVVIHLAAITKAAGSFDDQSAVEQINYEGTKKVVDACCKTGSKLIFISSTSVYNSSDAEMTEASAIDTANFQSPYAKSKYQAEQYIREQTASGKIKATICRFGTIFGTSPGMRFHTAVNYFCWQACGKQPISIWKTALHQKRPYLDLKDAMNAFGLILNKNIFNGELYNLATANITVQDIIDTIKTILPDIQTALIDSKAMNTLSYGASVKKFEQLGFSFQGRLKTAVRETIDRLRHINSLS